MTKYKYISYHGKGEVIVNEQPKPEIMNYTDDGINFQKGIFEDHLKAFNESCKTIPIAEGHERKFYEYAYSKWDDIINTPFNSFLESGIILPSEFVRFERVEVKRSANIIQYKETAYFIEKEQETNEAHQQQLASDIICMIYAHIPSKVNNNAHANLIAERITEDLLTDFTITRKHQTK